MDGAGHWLQRDCPEGLNALLLGFLEDVQRGGVQRGGVQRSKL